MSDLPALQPDLAVGEALSSTARSILVEARASLELPGKSDSTAVHDFRRQMKRWRALLRLLKPVLDEDGQRLGVQARDLARALGGARDAQSALDALTDLAKHDLALTARSQTTVRSRIEQIRQNAETTILTGDMRLSIAAALDTAEAAVGGWPLQTLTFGDIAESLTRGYRAARRRRPAVWPQADAEELHELRKRVVNLRYQMEIVRPLWRPFVKMWTAEAQRLRDQLGKHQDLLVLTRLTGLHQPLAHWRSSLLPAIEKSRAVHVDKAARIAGRLFDEKPSVFRRRLETMWKTAN